MNSMITRYWMKTLLLWLLLACPSYLSGCFYQYAEFNPLKGQTPIILFGNYLVDMHGYAAGGHNFYCDFAFVHITGDTTNLDTIPVLILDSICFRGACLNGDFCLNPTSWFDQDQESIRKGHGQYHSHGLIRGRDLYYVAGRVVPGGYSLMNAYRLSEKCDKNDVIVVLWVRMLERVTGKEIARESKIVQFRIKRGSRLGMS